MSSVANLNVGDTVELLRDLDGDSIYPKNENSWLWSVPDPRCWSQKKIAKGQKGTVMAFAVNSVPSQVKNFMIRFEHLDSHIDIRHKPSKDCKTMEEFSEMFAELFAQKSFSKDSRGTGRGRSLGVPLEWCENAELKEEYSEIEKKQAQVVRDHTAEKITAEEKREKLSNLKTRREELIDLIRQDVESKCQKEHGLTFELFKKLGALQKKDINRAIAKQQKAQEIQQEAQEVMRNVGMKNKMMIDHVASKHSHMNPEFLEEEKSRKKKQREDDQAKKLANGRRRRRKRKRRIQRPLRRREQQLQRRRLKRRKQHRPRRQKRQLTRQKSRQRRQLRRRRQP